MIRRFRPAAVLAVALVALLLPAAASAHAYLTKTFPSASATLDSPPNEVALTFDEAVEPRFAIISVTDKDAHQVTTGPVTRSPANPDTLTVPAAAASAGGLVPRLLAGDLGRRPPRAGRVHLRGRSRIQGRRRSS